MATFKVCVFRNHLRKDGTYNVKLRITHNCQTRKISTPFYVEEENLSPDLQITDDELVDLCEDLCHECRRITRELGYKINGMTIDELVHYLKLKLQGGGDFRLDFCKFWREQAETMKPGTRGIYISALNAFQRFIHAESYDIMRITSHTVNDFLTFIKQEPSQRGSNRLRAKTRNSSSKTRAVSLYLACMRSIYNRAKFQFNDEDYGHVPISRAPFAKIKIPEHVAAKRAISPETLQRIIDLPYREVTMPGAKRFNLAKDCFLLSFGLIGMNSADMYSCKNFDGTILFYERQKTCTRRSDRAEMQVRIEPVISTLMAKYRDPTHGHVFRFYRDYISSDAFNRALNRGLKMIAADLGLPNLQFYAARHTWATIARSRLLNIEKETVHEALNHVDLKMRVTDMYIEKDWSVIWEANRKVLELFKWPV